jgi:glycerol-3-phosphate acyltransferase PlsY
MDGLPTLPANLTVFTLIAWILGAYLLGSIPVAWLLTKLITGKDLRQTGSGNVGVMNTALSATRWAGLLAFLSEAVKGFLAVIIPRSQDQGEIIVGLVVIAVVVGTRWPIWLGFKGGRGNTAGLSALLLISWQTLAFSLAVWVLARLLVHHSFIASRITLAMLPILTAGVTRSWWYALLGLALAVIYLAAQQRRSDDHQLIKERWPSFWAFLTSPRRRER